MRTSIKALLGGFVCGMLAVWPAPMKADTTIVVGRAPAAAASSLLTGLVAGYKCEEAGGANNLIDVLSTLDLTQVGSPGSAAGVNGNARSLDGSTQRFELASSTFNFQNTDFAVSLRFRMTADQANQWLIWYGTPGSHSSWMMSCAGAGSSFLFTVETAAGNFSATSTATAVTGQYYHIVGWHDATADTVNIRVDDASTQNLTTSGNAPKSGTTINVGALTTIFFANGRVDDIYIWSRTLTAGEITTLLTAEHPF